MRLSLDLALDFERHGRREKSMALDTETILAVSVVEGTYEEDDGYRVYNDLAKEDSVIAGDTRGNFRVGAAGSTVVICNDDGVFELSTPLSSAS